MWEKINLSIDEEENLILKSALSAYIIHCAEEAQMFAKIAKHAQTIKEHDTAINLSVTCAKLETCAAELFKRIKGEKIK